MGEGQEAGWVVITSVGQSRAVDTTEAAVRRRLVFFSILTTHTRSEETTLARNEEKSVRKTW